jgi:hypothetical protein
MKITIAINDNGAVMRIPIGAYNDYEKNMVYKFDADEHTNIKDYVNMLWDITEAIMLFSKNSPQRININIEHGANYICKDKKCEICKK